jgi:transcriptional regulator with XRE-family HTH domain
MNEPTTQWRRSVNGEVVRAIREALGISTTEFAADVGISRQYLYQVEAGSKQPRLPTVKAIADRLGVTPNAITRYLPAPVEATEEEQLDEPAGAAS